jgi:hypothetical protein
MWGGFGGMGGGFPARQVFEEQYHCYSVAYADKGHLEVRVVCVCVRMFGILQNQIMLVMAAAAKNNGYVHHVSWIFVKRERETVSAYFNVVKSHLISHPNFCSVSYLPSSLIVYSIFIYL